MLNREVEILSTEGLNFRAIGKITFKTAGRWSIPHLHFMINQADDGVYEAICIELQHFNSGKTIEESVKNMALHLLDFLSNNIQNESDIDKLIDCVDTNDMDDYWKQYRVIDFNLAKLGKDINSSLEEKLKKDIEKEYAKKYQEKIKEFEKQNSIGMTVVPYVDFDSISIKTNSVA